MTEQQHMSEEQVKELQEKIKNMSPEELKEFQKKQCIFCQIIAGKIQSKTVYEDNNVLAILDINPGNPGHILILPKEHYSIMPQIPEDLLNHLFVVVKTLSNAALRSLEVGGANIVVANGVAAGQKAQHFMIHLIPRKEGDGINFEIPQNTHSEKELQELAEGIAAGLGGEARQVTAPVAASAAAASKEVVDAEFEEKEGAEESEEGKVPVAEESAAQKSSDVDLDSAMAALSGDVSDEGSEEELFDETEDTAEHDEDIELEEPTQERDETDAEFEDDSDEELENEDLEEDPKDTDEEQDNSNDDDYDDSDEDLDNGDETSEDPKEDKESRDGSDLDDIARTLGVK